MQVIFFNIIINSNEIKRQNSIKNSIFMNRENIIIKNAHTNNLKNIDIEIPKHKLVVFTGV